jgi:Tol biopolymer transport system component
MRKLRWQARISPTTDQEEGGSMTFLSSGRVGFVALLAVALAAVAALPAGATVSGTNGQIAFARQLPGGGANIFIANPDGQHTQQVPLVYPAENFGIPRWSPDSSHLLISNVFRFDTSGNLLPFRPATVGLDGGNFNLLEPPSAPFDMACFGGWYPDATRLLCGYGEGPPGVFSIRASDGGDPARLTTYPFGTNCNTCDEATDVSPDGSRFVFLRFRRENAANFREEQVALFLENTDGTGLQQITPYGLAAPHEAAAARWSPDGKEIISETTQGRLFVVRPDGSGLSMIPLDTGTTRYFAFEPAFSPDGTKIVFCMFINGQEDIYTANADGSGVRQVTNTPDFENGPDWGTHPLAR